MAEDDIATLQRIADAAGERLFTAAGEAEIKAASAEKSAADRTLRAARRAAGEAVLTEDQRSVRATMGDIEDIGNVIKSAHRQMDSRVDKLERAVRLLTMAVEKSR